MASTNSFAAVAKMEEVDDSLPLNPGRDIQEEPRVDRQSIPLPGIGSTTQLKFCPRGW